MCKIPRDRRSGRLSGRPSLEGEQIRNEAVQPKHQDTRPVRIEPSILVETPRPFSPPTAQLTGRPRRALSSAPVEPRIFPAESSETIASSNAATGILPAVRIPLSPAPAGLETT